MVVYKNMPTIIHEMQLDSGKKIKYFVPRSVYFSKEISPLMREAENSIFGMSFFLNYSLDAHSSEDWEGVKDFCQAIENMIENERDRTLLKGKKVLEVGFCTGIPSVFALQSGAKEVGVYCDNKAALECYIKPTFFKNNIRPENFKIMTTSQLNTTNSDENGYDVIIAPELISNADANLEVFHSIFERVLKDGGLILLTGRTFYNNYEGNIPSFLDFIKSKGQFEAIHRCTLHRQDQVPRKMIQLSRRIDSY